MPAKRVIRPYFEYNDDSLFQAVTAMRKQLHETVDAIAAIHAEQVVRAVAAAEPVPELVASSAEIYAAVRRVLNLKPGEDIDVVPDLKLALGLPPYHTGNGPRSASSTPKHRRG